MTERRDQSGPQPARVSSRKRDSEVFDLGSQAGNKAMAELLGQQQPATPPASAGLRALDSLRAAAQPAQREFALVAQRDLKEELKAPGRLLRVGTRGEDVRQAQQLLGVAVDGIFGDKTRAAVVGFQRSNGLAVDGIVGPNTWSALVAQADRLRAKEFADKQAAGEADKAVSSPEKIPSSTDKQEIPESTDKAPTSADKMAFPEEADKIPSSTDKQAISESTDKVPTSTDKQAIPGSADKLDVFK
jgi:peptidoglycan hydrolase-like protein with peptidoglycan-binding domain